MNTLNKDIHPTTPNFKDPIKPLYKTDIVGNPTGIPDVWASAAAEVNKRLFRVLVPLYILSKPIEEPKEVTKTHWFMGMEVKSTYTHKTPLPSTFYKPITPDQKGQTQLPLFKLIDLYLEGEPFEVIDDVEQIQMFLLMDIYLKEIEDNVKNDDEGGYADYALRVLKARPAFYHNFVRCLWRWEPRAEAFSHYKESYTSPVLKMLLGEDPNKPDRPDGIEKLETPPYSLEFVQSIIKKRDEVKKQTSEKHLDIKGDYLNKTDGEIRFKDPFDQEASNMVPELQGSSNVTSILKKSF